MLDLDTVTYDIERWIATFVEVPHPALGGWAPCPYARRARLDRDFEVRLGVNPYFDLKFIAHTGIAKSVVIFVYESTDYSYEISTGPTVSTSILRRSCPCLTASLQILIQT